ncbi:MAG: hypothetical protein QG639_646 [Patescibacteria group bacterium]|nr:hypothetical protein [Patescibacteria group bacterium]
MGTVRMHIAEAISHLFHPRRSNNHRPRVLHPEGLLSIAGLILGFGLFIYFSGVFNPQLGTILGYASDISATDVVSQTNAERAKAGLPALNYNAELSLAATAKANDMFAKQYWAHQSPEGVEPWKFIADAGYSYTAAGENLARDFMLTPDMIAAWMASPTHAANIMNARYQEIGVAVVNGTLEGIETTLVVQMFGRPTAVPVVAQVPSTAGSTETVTNIPPARTQPIPEPTPTIAENSVLPAEDIFVLPPTVLAESAVPVGSVQTRDAIFSPLQLTKAFGLSVLIIIVSTLLLDWYVSHQNGTIRLVGRNFAHILYFSAICFVLVLFRGGFIF